MSGKKLQTIIHQGAGQFETEGTYVLDLEEGRVVSCPITQGEEIEHCLHRIYGCCAQMGNVEAAGEGKTLGFLCAGNKFSDYPPNAFINPASLTGVVLQGPD